MLQKNVFLLFRHSITLWVVYGLIQTAEPPWHIYMQSERQAVMEFTGQIVSQAILC